MDSTRIHRQHRGDMGEGEVHTLTVESFTTRGKFYRVDLEAGFCSCPAFQIGGHRPCKHLRSLTLRYEIRKVHNSRLNGLFDNTEFHLVEFRGDKELRTISVSYSRSGAYLDRSVAEGMVA